MLIILIQWIKKPNLTEHVEIQIELIVKRQILCNGKKFLAKNLSNVYYKFINNWLEMF